MPPKSRHIGDGASSSSTACLISCPTLIVLKTSRAVRSPVYLRSAFRDSVHRFFPSRRQKFASAYLADQPDFGPVNGALGRDTGSRQRNSRIEFRIRARRRKHVLDGGAPSFHQRHSARRIGRNGNDDFRDPRGSRVGGSLSDDRLRFRRKLSRARDEEQHEKILRRHAAKQTAPQQRYCQKTGDEYPGHGSLPEDLHKLGASCVASMGSRSPARRMWCPKAPYGHGSGRRKPKESLGILG